jgi:hypothetical protein
MSSDKAYRALKERYCALEGEMLVLKDQLTCALLTMEESRKREAMSYLALRHAAGLLSTTPKFSSEHPEYIFEYLLNAPREKSGG